jgi:hypothetical protein
VLPKSIKRFHQPNNWAIKGAEEEIEVPRTWGGALRIWHMGRPIWHQTGTWQPVIPELQSEGTKIEPKVSLSQHFLSHNSEYSTKGDSSKVWGKDKLSSKTWPPIHSRQSLGAVGTQVVHHWVLFPLCLNHHQSCLGSSALVMQQDGHNTPVQLHSKIVSMKKAAFKSENMCYTNNEIGEAPHSCMGHQIVT